MQVFDIKTMRPSVSSEIRAANRRKTLPTTSECTPFDRFSSLFLLTRARFNDFVIQLTLQFGYRVCAFFVMDQTLAFVISKTSAIQQHKRPHGRSFEVKLPRLCIADITDLPTAIQFLAVQIDSVSCNSIPLHSLLS